VEEAQRNMFCVRNLSWRNPSFAIPIAANEKEGIDLAKERGAQRRSLLPAFSAPNIAMAELRSND